MSRRRVALGVRKNFAWNFVGNFAYSLSQWALLVLLARLADPAIVGRFALMLAIAAPVFLTVGMNLRTAQATDVSGRFHRREYRRLRHLLNGAATILTICIGAIAGLGSLLPALLGVCAAKATEALSQSDYGYFQQHERLDLVSRSLLARSLLGPVGFTAGFLVSADLAGATWGLAVGWGATQLALDRRSVSRLTGAEGAEDPAPRPGRIRRLAQQCAPLGADAGVSSLALNTPRYVISYLLGPATLGVFATLAYLSQAVSMITSSMAAALLPRLARAFQAGDRDKYLSILAKLVGFGIAVMLVAGLGAFLVGEQLLRNLLGPTYADRELLMALMVSAGAMTLQRMVCKGLEASRHFTTYFIVDLLTTAAIALCAIIMIPAWGVAGGAHAMTSGFLFGTAISLAAMLSIAKGMRLNDSPGDCLQQPADG